MLRLDVKKVIAFFDEIPDWSERHATAVVSVLGEDLAAAALQHCLEANGASQVNVRTEPVTTGRVKGPRLDRWIEADLPDGQEYLFQTEIKSWSAHAIGGKKLPIDASVDKMADEKRRNWASLWDEEARTLKRKDVAKVLVRMKPPSNTEGRKVLPLLIFWHPIGISAKSQGKQRVKGGHLFSVANPSANFPPSVYSSWPEKCDFPDLWVFSVTSYLRSVKQNKIELRMPQAAGRLRALAELVQLADD